MRGNYNDRYMEDVEEFLDKRSRRDVLKTSGAAIMGGFTAGCLGGQSGEQETQTDQTRNKTETETAGQEETQNTDTNPDEQTPEASEGEELDEEIQIQEALTQNQYDWIEVEDPYGNLEIPDSAMSDWNINGENAINASELRNYEDLIKLIGDEFYKTEQKGQAPLEQGAEIGSFILAFRDGREGSFEEPYDELGGALLAFESAAYPVDFMARSTPFEDGVVERFLQENVEGVSDYSEDIDEELLEYARS